MEKSETEITVENVPTDKPEEEKITDNCEPFPEADDDGSPPNISVRKASEGSQKELQDGIILLITTDTGSQRSLTGSFTTPSNLSEYYLVPVTPETISVHRRHSLRDEPEHHNPERKASCPDTGLHISPAKSRRNSSCSRSFDADRLTPSSFSSRRASNASTSHSRRSSTCSMAGHRKSRSRRSSTCSMAGHRKSRSRRSSTSSVNHSRRSSSPSHKSSSNCSRRSSRVESDEDLIHHHHRRSHRGSRASLEQSHPGSVAFVDLNGVSGDTNPCSFPNKDGFRGRKELEGNEIPLRHRKIIIMIIGSISIFILVMAVVLIAVSLTLSPTIDDLVIQREKERELINKVCCIEDASNTTNT